ncbi:hypothetical protein C8Q79DRAFT_583992 [Trametes meyenii]|nr:hypothetical protein C8Q79DRAFT_583992 [Trametes meyenii]
MSFDQLNLSTPLFASGATGFLGGDAAASATAVSDIYSRGWVLNLYNSPGSYEMSSRIANLVRSRFWDGLHAGTNVDPAALAQSTSKPGGPKFVATFSGTTIPNTGDVAQTVLDFCKAREINGVAPGRVTTPYAVTILELDRAPHSEVHPTFQAHKPFLPILASIGASAGCAVIGDWTSFSMIVLGMVCNAATSHSLRAGDLTFTRPAETHGAPAGDGFLEAGNEIVVLRGTESAVTAVTRGRFSLRFANERALGRLSTCAALSTLQCLAQLVIVPQGAFFGQLLFLLSIAISWVYNYCTSTLEKAKTKVVMEDLLEKPVAHRYSLGTRAAMAVFLMQALKPTNVEEQLAALIPNNTRVWSTWRKVVAERLSHDKPFFNGDLPATATTFTREEQTLLRTLLGDAQAASNVVI